MPGQYQNQLAENQTNPQKSIAYRHGWDHHPRQKRARDRGRNASANITSWHYRSGSGRKLLPTVPGVSWPLLRSGHCTAIQAGGINRVAPQPKVFPPIQTRTTDAFPCGGCRRIAIAPLSL